MNSPVSAPATIWIGGGSAAGKTTIARTIAMRYDLAWYRVDGHAYAHEARLVARGLVDQPDHDFDRRFLAPSPEELIRQFWRRAELTVPLILEDLHALGDGIGVVVEGPQLFPALVESHLPGPDHSVWLTATGQFRRTVLEERIGDSSKFTSDAMRALDKRIHRDALLDTWTRAQACQRGLRVMEVDGSEGLPEMTARVVAHLDDALSAMPAASSGQGRRLLRQRENDWAAANVKAYLAELGGAAPAGWKVPVVCECEHLGCEAMTGLTLEDVARLRAKGRPVTAHDEVATSE